MTGVLIVYYYCFRVQAIFPIPDPTALRDKKMNNLVHYARKVEADMHETANSRVSIYLVIMEFEIFLRIWGYIWLFRNSRLFFLGDQNCHLFL